MADIALMHRPERPSDEQGPDRAQEPQTAAELARAAAAGDLGAAQTLVKRVSPALARAVYSVMGSTHREADDVIQQALIAFVQALPAFRGDSHPTTYATRIAVRTALATRRRSRSERGRRDAFADFAALRRSEPGTPIEQLQATARRALVRHLLDELPVEQAETLALHVVVGLSLKEVAAATSAPVNTVKSRLRLAKQALRTRIEAEPGLAEELGVAS
ncbi:MAG: sigma-70 family RNA polymerase sigma factor [Deltaproteobacteria bacterium]|nr:sigma-70 family RNA polymerase sigma factor [Deltaproteobacteria bacterium]